MEGHSIGWETDPEECAAIWRSVSLSNDEYIFLAGSRISGGAAGGAQL
jgi:hypothetical protein